jgi:hypothetical protein
LVDEFPYASSKHCLTFSGASPKLMIEQLSVALEPEEGSRKWSSVFRRLEIRTVMRRCSMTYVDFVAS